MEFCLTKSVMKKRRRLDVGRTVHFVAAIMIKIKQEKRQKKAAM